MELLRCTQPSSTALLRSPSWKLQGQLTVGSELPRNQKKSEAGKLSCWSFLVDLKEPRHRSWFRKDRKAGSFGGICRWHFLTGGRVNAMREGAWKEKATMVRKLAGGRRSRAGSSRSPCPDLTAGGRRGMEVGMGKLPSLSVRVPAGLRARRRTNAGRKSGGCRRWPTSKNPPREREPVKPWPSLNWRRGE